MKSCSRSDNHVSNGPLGSLHSIPHSMPHSSRERESGSSPASKSWQSRVDGRKRVESQQRGTAVCTYLPTYLPSVVKSARRFSVSLCCGSQIFLVSTAGTVLPRLLTYLLRSAVAEQPAEQSRPTRHA